MADEAQKRAATTYNAASDSYDHVANSFWERFGKQTVERLKLASGSQVLDVCCGSGASAIPAAEAVGPSGSVLGIDLAENLLTLARSKAQQRGLTNINFQLSDMLAPGVPESSFDAVVCVFGIFFVPDMETALEGLWRLVRPGGQLAITTWGPRFFEPASAAFWNSIRSVRPDLYKGFNPWDRLTDPISLRELFQGAGVTNVEIAEKVGTHPVGSPEDWWAMVMGTGYRGTVDQLTQTDVEVVRRENLDFIRDNKVHAVEANVLYSVAIR